MRRLIRCFLQPIVKWAWLDHFETAFLIGVARCDSERGLVLVMLQGSPIAVEIWLQPSCARTTAKLLQQAAYQSSELLPTFNDPDAVHLHAG